MEGRAGREEDRTRGGMEKERGRVEVPFNRLSVHVKNKRKRCPARKQTQMHAMNIFACRRCQWPKVTETGTEVLSTQNGEQRKRETKRRERKPQSEDSKQTGKVGSRSMQCARWVCSERPSADEERCRGIEQSGESCGHSARAALVEPACGLCSVQG